MLLAEFWEKVNTICAGLGGSVTSGIRSQARNAQVGGKPNSRHLTGHAADIVLDDWNKKTDAIFIATKAGLRVVDEVKTRGHLHMQAPQD